MAPSLRESFELEFPDFPWLHAGAVNQVERLLRDLGWIGPDEPVLSADRAGEGNMNLTLRVTTPQRSLILKQSRPWVEKYDHIEAPWDRIHAEQSFYQRTGKIGGLDRMMPRLLGSDAAARLLLLEDLAPARDMTGLYAGETLDSVSRDALAAFLHRLHAETEGESSGKFENRDMRMLNHAHIFVLPLSGDLDLPLDEDEPGLGDAARALRKRKEYVERIQGAGERYLGAGNCLLHGDFFPGSWLLTEAGPRIIDPEFCFLGDPEFDLGVALAHFALARQSATDAWSFLKAAGGTRRNSRWISRYAAAEVMRRLIGVARLPIIPTEHWRAGMLERSVRAALNDDWEALWA